MSLDSIDAYKMDASHALPAHNTHQAPESTFALGDLTGAERLDEFEQVSQREPPDNSFVTRVTEVLLHVCVCRHLVTRRRRCNLPL